MPRELLTRAVEQARDRDPVVRAMALLSASRVLSSIDKEEARRIFAEGVVGVESLGLSEHGRALVLDQAVQLGASADPIAAIELFRRQPPNDHPGRRWAGTVLVRALGKIGDFERAVALLEDLACDVGGAGHVLQAADDSNLKLRAISAARERWRLLRRSSSRHRSRLQEREFYSLISFYWRLLGPEEANRWLDEILLAIEIDPDERTHAGYNRGVELHSSRDVSPVRGAEHGARVAA